MPTAKVIRTGTDRNDEFWAQLQKQRQMKFGNVSVSAFVRPEQELEVGQEVELTRDDDEMIRWEA